MQYKTLYFVITVGSKITVWQRLAALIGTLIEKMQLFHGRLYAKP